MSNSASNGKKGFAYHFFGIMNVALVLIMIVMVVSYFVGRDWTKEEAKRQKGLVIVGATLTPIETSDEVMDGFTISDYQLENNNIHFYEITVDLHNYGQTDIVNYEFEFPYVYDSNEAYIQFEPNTYYGPDDDMPTSSLHVLPPGETMTMHGRIMIEGEDPDYLMYYKSYEAYQNGEATKIDM